MKWKKCDCSTYEDIKLCGHMYKISSIKRIKRWYGFDLLVTVITPRRTEKIGIDSTDFVVITKRKLVYDVDRINEKIHTYLNDDIENYRFAEFMRKHEVR